MKMIKSLQGLTLAMATFGIVIPVQPILASSPAAAPASIARDVALAKGGVLHGQILNDAGRAASEEIVSLVVDGKEVARTKRLSMQRLLPSPVQPLRRRSSCWIQGLRHTLSQILQPLLT